MINYNGRRFRPSADEPGAAGRVAVYHQEGDLLWGDFTGGHARGGTLVGRCADDGTLDFAYCMVLDTGEVISGHCRSTPTVLTDGRIRLHEVWQRYGAHAGNGNSWLEEIEDSTHLEHR